MWKWGRIGALTTLLIGCNAVHEYRRARRSSEKNMRYVLIIATLLGSTVLVRAQSLDRDKWVGQTARANKACLAKFRQKFGEAKDRNYADCVTDQTNKEIDACVGNSEFSSCVFQRSLRVLEVCDLSKC